LARTDKHTEALNAAQPSSSLVQLLLSILEHAVTSQSPTLSFASARTAVNARTQASGPGPYQGRLDVSPVFIGSAN
jgi:hypothetical protein